MVVRVLSGLAGVAGLAGAAPPASAQTDEARAAARSAAMDGLRALNEGRYQEAVDLCTRAESLMHAPTHLLLIARAQTKLGHLVEAQEAYIKIERDHLAPNAPKAFVDAQSAAADEHAALTPRVPTLEVTLEGDPKDVQLTLDGAPYPAALVGMASPIDPGTHTLQAKSPTAASDPVTVTLAESAKESVTLTLRPLASAETTPAPAEDEGVPESKTSSHAGERTAGWIGVGLGAVGLAVGTVFVIKNHSDRNDANGLCEARGCPESKRPEITSFDNEANSASTLAWVAYGVGAAGIVTGAALLWFGRGKPTTPQTGLVVPWFGARAMGIRVTFE